MIRKQSSEDIIQYTNRINANSKFFYTLFSLALTIFVTIFYTIDPTILKLICFLVCSISTLFQCSLYNKWHKMYKEYNKKIDSYGNM